jgi:hypothetical protein
MSMFQSGKTVSSWRVRSGPGGQNPHGSDSAGGAGDLGGAV